MITSPSCGCCIPPPGPCCDTTPYEDDITLTISSVESEEILVFSGSATFDIAQLNGTFVIPRAESFGAFVPCNWQLGELPPDGTNPTVTYEIGYAPFTGYLQFFITVADHPSGKELHLVIRLMQFTGSPVETIYDGTFLTGQDCVDFDFSSAFTISATTGLLEFLYG